VTLSSSLVPLRRTSSQLLAAAVLELFPTSLIVRTETAPYGFYADFQFPFEFQKEFISLIEQKMGEIVRRNPPIKYLAMMPENASAFLAHHGQYYRAEAVKEYEEALIELFQMGEFVNFSLAPHHLDLSSLQAFKLFNARSLPHDAFTRIEGTAFFNKQELKQFLKKFDESVTAQDHLFWIKELDLLSQSPERGSGFWRWHPKGEKVRYLLEQYWRETLQKKHFDFISTPKKLLASSSSVQTELFLSHLSFFKSFQKSNGRLAELSYVERPLAESEKRGMLNSCGFFADQAHILCSSHEVVKECISSLQFLIEISKIFNFQDYRLILRCSPAIGNRDKNWNDAEEALQTALRECGLAHDIETKQRTLSGPLVEMQIRDLIGQEWTGPFVGIECLHAPQLHSGQKVVVFSFFSSMERFLALILENCQGKLPFWLAPEQVRIFAVGGHAHKYAEEVFQILEDQGFRVGLSTDQRTLSSRMHGALKEKVPYTVVLGDREQKANKLTIREYPSKEANVISLEEFIEILRNKNRKN